MAREQKGQAGGASARLVPAFGPVGRRRPDAGAPSRALGMSLAVMALLFLGVIIVAAKIAAPFVYTLS